MVESKPPETRKGEESRRRQQYRNIPESVWRAEGLDP